MEMSFNHNGKFVSLLEFAHNRNTTFLVIPEGLERHRLRSITLHDFFAVGSPLYRGSGYEKAVQG